MQGRCWGFLERSKHHVVYISVRKYLISPILVAMNNSYCQGKYPRSDLPCTMANEALLAVSDRSKNKADTPLTLYLSLNLPGN